MKELYPNKKMDIRYFSLSEKQLNEFKKNRKKFGGFNSSNDYKGNLEYIWLSPSGKIFIEKYIQDHDYWRRIKQYSIRFIDWIFKYIPSIIKLFK